MNAHWADMVELRFRAYCAYEAFQPSELSRAAIARNLVDAASQASENGLVKTYYEGNDLLAYIVMWHESTSWFGQALTFCKIDFTPENKASVAWVKEMIRDHDEFSKPDLFIELDAHYQCLLPELTARGLGVDSVVYLGHPESAMRALRDAKWPRLDLQHHGLEIEHMRSSRDVAAVLELRSDYFTTHPEFCFFGGTPGSLKRLEANLTDALDGNHLHFVIRRGESVVGYFGADVDTHQPYWGNSAGLDIVLAPDIQGKGIVKTLYAYLLSELTALGVRVFKGGTSQPAIIGLAEIMNRPRFRICMRQNVAFDLNHFGLVAPTSEQVK